LEDQSAGPFQEERGDPVYHVRGSVFGKESQCQLVGIDLVKASLYIEKKSGNPKLWAGKGSTFMGEGGAGVKRGEVLGIPRRPTHKAHAQTPA